MRRRSIAGCLGALLLGGCLPNDTRPPPGELLMQVEGDAQLMGGLDADAAGDGWVVRYERVLVSIRGVSLEGDGCESYALGNGYNRVLDLLAPGKQKVNLVHALGACEVGTRIGHPSSMAVLGERVTDADVLEMRMAQGDEYELGHGASMIIAGEAERAGTVKRFNWRLSLEVGLECKLDDGDSAGRLVLESEQKVQLTLAARGAALFASATDPEQATVGFGAFALADDEYGDADGEVTLGELRLVPLSETAVTLDAEDPEQEGLETLGDFFYRALAPRFVGLEGGECEVHIRREGDEGDEERRR